MQDQDKQTGQGHRRTIGIRWAGAAIITGAVLSACESSGGNAGPVPIDDLIDQFSSAECELLVRCHLVSDQAFCLDWFEPFNPPGRFNSLGTIVAGVHAGRVRYDAVGARSCLDVVRGGACTEVNGSTIIASTCLRIFTGTIGDDGPCLADAECTPGSFCARPDGLAGLTSCAATCRQGGTLCNDDTQCTNGQVCDLTAFTGPSNGTCVTARPPAGANQPCGTNNKCQPGLYCRTLGPDPTCVPLGQLGQPCEFSGVGGCVPGLICVFRDEDASATCMAPAAKGQACQVRGQCGAPLLSSIVCDETRHLCVDAPTSGPCMGMGLSSCNILSSYCDTSQATPTCTANATIGAACAVGSPACGITGASCRETTLGSLTGTCVAPASCLP